MQVGGSETSQTPILTKTAESGAAPVSRRLKLAILCAVTLQNAGYALVRRYSRGYLHECYSASSALFVMEMAKLLLSAVYVCTSDAPSDVPSGTPLSKYLHLLRHSAKMAVPAVIYLIMNLLGFLSLAHIDASTFAIVSQMKVRTPQPHPATANRNRNSYPQPLPLPLTRICDRNRPRPSPCPCPRPHLHPLTRASPVDLAPAQPSPGPHPPSPQQPTPSPGLHHSRLRRGAPRAKAPHTQVARPPQPHAWRRSMLKTPPLTAPELAVAPPQGALGGSGRLGTTGGEAMPLGVQPRPRVLEPGASNVADFIACVFGLPGVVLISSETSPARVMHASMAKQAVCWRLGGASSPSWPFKADTSGSGLLCTPARRSPGAIRRRA